MNATGAENARPGTPDWTLQRPALDRGIEGYAGATSVQRGEVIGLYVSTGAAHWTLEVFRCGWYGGAGARRVHGPVRLPGGLQPMPAMDEGTGLVDCAWNVSCRLATRDADTGEPWPTGVYLARLTAGLHGPQSYAIFVVRDDARAGGLLVQLPVTTYQAYNAWGGKSLYHWGSSGRQRATRVSFNRPYAANAQNPAAAVGMGAGEFIANLQPAPANYGISNAGWDINFLRWLEREGLDACWCTNLDVHADALLPRRHRAWLSIGHDEYWSRPMREHVQQARDAGTHLGFFSANSAYWQVRLEPSAASGTADRILVCHKKAARDPWRPAGPHERSCATDKWRSSAVGEPEEALIGVMYAADPVDGDIVVQATDHWACAGTGLRPGDRLPGLLGYEVDAVHGHGPDGVQVLAASPWTTLEQPPRSGTAHMVTYTAASGAVVFATGSIQWAWGLDDHNAPALRSARGSAAAAQITRNVLRRFLG